MTITADSKTVPVTPAIYRYLHTHTEPPSAAQQALIERTHELGQPAEMQIPHEQAVFLTMLTRICDARCVVEIGTFTGYSTLAFALGMRSGGRVITCDLSDEWMDIARQAWSEAGVAERIEPRVGPALDTLRALPDRPFIDLAFIDADKPRYHDYWEQLVPRVRAGGLLLADNVFYGGEAVSPDASGNAAAIRAFNERVRADERVESVMLPIADGLTLARKRESPEHGRDGE
ncbi:O-methyltransferase [Actinobacteria bacterium YIM 96077]|uniref:O-methyltransferase n=1 Tax=Phytoactinopolyspora halophila TaxID=1981511 RepID=A0A329QDD2_9ACTN|nr:O-methyltransferase [Phytoactinopolyspora halophila]AYY13063.1 O-methyltransferase [Actinobacteria bacterium YIM 96077]RAW09242.1 O-methyltransferase [Phytoactinopolyspora halophila]